MKRKKNKQFAAEIIRKRYNKEVIVKKNTENKISEAILAWSPHEDDGRKKHGRRSHIRAAKSCKTRRPIG